jgi:Uma2 family endonuclease
MVTTDIMQPILNFENLAEIIKCLGNVPLDRICVNPPLGTATETDVLELLGSIDKRICELIDGVLVMKPLSIKKSVLNAYLVYALMSYLDVNDLGIAIPPCVPIRIRQGCIRIPDVGFISWQRLPDGKIPDVEILGVLPELAVEVLDESNTKQEMDLKLDDYFQAGMKLVWIIDPKMETVTVYTSRHKKKVLTSEQSIDGGKILPGFSLPIKKLFAHIHRSKPE